MAPLRYLTGFIVAVAAFLGISAPQEVRRERPEDRELETWQDFGRMSALIHALPAWNDQDDLTAEEWKSVANLALAFQGLRDSEIETALITYMNLYRGQDDQTHSGRTKPLLLLRLMFDTSKRTKYATDSHGKRWRERGYQPCGGFVFTETRVSSTWDLDALPIEWIDGMPSLKVKRVVGPVIQGGGPPRHSYQPHLDFRYLRDMYERRDLCALARSKELTWVELAREADLFADQRLPEQ